MNADFQKALQSPGLYVLLFVLGDVFMIPTRGPNIISWIFIALAAAGAGTYFWKNVPRLRR